VAPLADYVLVYDADCGMCTRFRNTVEFLDTHRNLGFTSIDHAEQIGLLDSLPDSWRHRSFHLILPDSQVESGSPALPTLIRLLPAGAFISRLILSAPKGQDLLGFLYSVVARRHEAGLCKLHDASAHFSSELDNLTKKTKPKLSGKTHGTGSSVSLY
jgi:predicted DCC family thiol-disulfide oxidoreductase YuxK